MNTINPKYDFEPTIFPSVNELYNGILSGNRSVLSRAITLVESTHEKHQDLKRDLLKKCAIENSSAYRIGITGVPGAGKSTFIESYGLNLIQNGHKVAVLAIDPSSTKTGGSILGDKTRMQELSVNENAFIRPSSSGGQLGGASAFTREVMMLCEAAGYDRILVETVGVGQSETTLSELTDVFLLLVVPGTGDELQGIKRGIMEMADIIIINKCDGDNVSKSKLVSSQLKSALHLFPMNLNGWITSVLSISSLQKTGINELNNEIEKYFRHMHTKDLIKFKRENQKLFWLNEYFRRNLIDSFTNRFSSEELEKLKLRLIQDNATVYDAANELVKKMKL